MQLDVPPDAALSSEAREADILRRRARLWLMGLQAGADSLARNRAAARYFIGAEPRLILAAMLYGATGPDETENGHIDFILEPGPFRQALERALRPGPFYGAWQSLLDELRAVLARTPEPDSPEEARQAAWLRALLGPARRALAAADDGWLATADQALTLEHAATQVEESPLLWLLLAEATLQRDQPQRCVGACGRALALDPSLARARYIRALGYWRLHQAGIGGERPFHHPARRAARVHDAVAAGPRRYPQTARQYHGHVRGFHCRLRAGRGLRGAGNGPAAGSLPRGAACRGCGRTARALSRRGGPDPRKNAARPNI